MAGVVILYEDQAAAAPNEYGPHKLVCWLLWDRFQQTGVNLAFFDICKLVRGNPRKGVDKVRASCRENLEDFAADGTFVIALVDDDRIREHLGLPKNACIAQTTAAFREGCEPAHRLRVVLLARRMESVVDAVVSITAAAPALGKPTPAERDIRLKRACGESQAAARAELLRRVPSLGYLVEKIDAALRPKGEARA